MFDGDKTPLAIPGDEGKSLSTFAAGEKFTGQFKKTSLLRGTGDGGRGTGEEGRKLILAGLGKRKEFELDRVRSATAKALKRAEEIGAESVGLLVPDNKEVRETWPTLRRPRSKARFSQATGSTSTGRRGR